MLKNKERIFILLLSVFLISFSNVSAGPILLNVNTAVSPTRTYVSPTFVPTANKVAIVISGGGGSSGSITYSLQRYNAGSWVTVDTGSFGPNGGKTVIPTVVSGSTHRLRISSTVSTRVTSYIEDRTN